MRLPRSITPRLYRLAASSRITFGRELGAGAELTRDRTREHTAREQLVASNVLLIANATTAAVEEIAQKAASLIAARNELLDAPAIDRLAGV